MCVLLWEFESKQDGTFYKSFGAVEVVVVVVVVVAAAAASAAAAVVVVVVAVVVVAAAAVVVVVVAAAVVAKCVLTTKDSGKECVNYSRLRQSSVFN